MMCVRMRVCVLRRRCLDCTGNRLHLRLQSFLQYSQRVRKNRTCSNSASNSTPCPALHFTLSDFSGPYLTLSFYVEQIYSGSSLFTTKAEVGYIRKRKTAAARYVNMCGTLLPGVWGDLSDHHTPFWAALSVSTLRQSGSYQVCIYFRRDV